MSPTTKKLPTELILTSSTTGLLMDGALLYFIFNLLRITEGRLVERVTSPFSRKIGYIGQGLGWRFSSTRLMMAINTVTYRPQCLFCTVTNQNGKG